jgi:membrane protein DedA with SNARE-associated domain
MRGLANLFIQLLTAHSTVLAALISLQTLQNALSVIGYPAVTLFIMIESSGIPFPGETMLLLASFFAATSHQLAIPIVIACAALGAIIGDNLGYLAGRTGGRALALRYGKYIFLKPHHLDYAGKFFEKHGDKTVFFGRFVAVLRAWAAFLAGVNHMQWRKFLIYNAAGGILWAIVYGTLGYVAGRFLHDNFAAVEHIASTLGWIGVGIVVLFAAAVFILLRLRRRKRMLAAIEREVKADAPDDEEQAIQQQTINKPVPGGTESAQNNVEPEPAPDRAGSLQK